MQAHSSYQPSSKKIFEIGMAFWSSKILLSAVNLGLFTLLAKNQKLRAKEIGEAFNFKCLDRHVYDYLDSLTALGFLNREGLLQTAQYSNAPDADFFLDKAKTSYIGGMLQLANNNLYITWGSLQEGLRTGLPQYHIPNDGKDFADFYKNAEQMKEFMRAMSGIHAKAFTQFAKSFDFQPYHTLVDAGGALADLSIAVSKQHQHMKCISLDLEAVEYLAKENIEKHHISDRVSTAVGDFFKDPLPKGDVVVMGNILHDWGMEKKKKLIASAFEALSPGGAFVVIENIIDQDRRKNLFGMQMSLNMLLETEGFDYTFSEFDKWAKDAGFTRTCLLHLHGSVSAAIAYK